METEQRMVEYLVWLLYLALPVAVAILAYIKGRNIVTWFLLGYLFTFPSLIYIIFCRDKLPAFDPMQDIPGIRIRSEEVRRMDEELLARRGPVTKFLHFLRNMCYRKDQRTIM